jgi:hypothetical protein
LDGTELAEGILPYVTQLMKGLEGFVLLLSVIDPDEVELPERLRHVPAATLAPVKNPRKMPIPSRTKQVGLM